MIEDMPNGEVNLDGDLIPAMPPAKAMLCLGEHYKNCSVHVKRCMRFGSLTHALYLLWVYLEGENVHADRPTCWLVFRDEQVDEGTESRPLTLSDVTHLVGNITEAEFDAISTRPAGNPQGLDLVAKIAEIARRLPEGMEGCTIVCRECLVGHAWLTATNWIDHGCPWCRIAEVERERDALLRAVEHAMACWNGDRLDRVGSTLRQALDQLAKSP